MLPPLSFSNMLIVAAIAFTVPLILGFLPGLRVPSIVVEIGVGIILGPSGLGLVQVDVPVQMMALIGLTFALFLAGLETDFGKLRGPLLRVAGLGFLFSLGLALLVGYGLQAAGLAETPLFIGIILAATALTVVVPVLKDAGRTTTTFGQLMLVSGTLADVGTITLISLLFSRQASGPAMQISLIGGLALLALVGALTLTRLSSWGWFSPVFVRLQDSSAQIRVRGAFVLLAVFVVLADRLGLQVTLGAYMAGAILNLVDREQMMTHSHFRLKLEAIGFGIFIPFFFIVSGLRFDLHALTNPAALVRIPLFLAAMLFVRGVPALLYRRLIGDRQAIAAGLLQATTLGFVVVASQLGMEIGAISSATGAALIAAALLSVLIFPSAALAVLRRDKTPARAQGPIPEEA
ncbi:MAG: cation:proton antiporter [Anaerolineae bacterium]